MSSVMAAPTNTTFDPLADHSTTRRTRPVLAVLAVALLGFGLIACTSGEATTNVAAVNTLRASVGVPELTRVAELDLKAQAQADRMAKRAAIYHSKSLTSGVSGGWSGIAENVAMAGSIEQAQAALEASPDHYANMTNGVYTEMGVGVTIRDGVVYLVQVFVGR